MKEVVELNDRNWSQTIANGVTLVDFWAPWCGPCMLQGPILEQVAEKVTGQATVAKVNVDGSPDIAAQYGIRSIPTLMIFKDGNLQQQLVGVHSEAQLVDALSQVA